MYTKSSISNILIVISVIATFLVSINPALYIFWMNNSFLNQWIYYIYIIQFFTGSFIHAWFVHLFFNSIFIYFFWNIVELIIWRNKFIVFFVFVTIFNWVLLSIFTVWNTIWISWFCMALITYYTLELKSKNNPEYKWWITAILLNIWIWFIPSISLLWHLFWTIAWVIFYLLNKQYLKRKMVWLIIEKGLIE